MPRRLMRSSRRTRRSGNRPIRAREWLAFTSSATTNYEEPSSINIAPDFYNNTWLLSPLDAQAFYDEPTVVRLIIRITAYPEILPDDFLGNWEANLTLGIIVTKSDEATPNNLIDIGDPTKDWLWWAQFQFYHRLNTGTAIAQLPASSGSADSYDIRAKRRIPDGSGLAIGWANYSSGLAPSVPAANVRFFVQGRYLLLN